MYAHENPLRMERVERLEFRPQGCAWDDLLIRLKTLRYRAAVMGPDGSGKTTLLEQLTQRLSESTGLRGHLQLHNAEVPQLDWQTIRRLGAGDVLLLDGADLLPTHQWWLLRLRTRQLGGLVVTSHTRQLLPTLITCQTSPSLLAELLGDLLPASDIHRVDAMAAEYYARHAGNLRDALRAVYDVYADQGQRSCHD